MNSTPFPENELAHFLQSILPNASKKANLVSLPHLFVPRSHLVSQTNWEDNVLGWLIRQGLNGGRTTKSTYHGYQALFSELNGLPPWVQVEFEDLDGPITPERKRELTPLYVQAQTDTTLEKQFREHYLQTNSVAKEYLNMGLPDDPELLDVIEAEFHEKLNLVRMLGINIFEEVYRAIFGAALVDDGIEGPLPVTGAPDLFIWINQPKLSFWFFAEVKGPNDRIRASQYEWINENWETIKGHIMIISVF